MLLSLSFTLVLFLEVAKCVDPCSYIAKSFANGGLVKTSEALSCMKSFSYNSTLAKAITETLYKTFDLHVYKDISKNSPTPEFPLKVDVLAGIKEISNTTYGNDYDFNRALYKLIHSLNDGHAVYAPYCYYAYLVSYTAVPLVSVVVGGEHIVKISPAISLFTSIMQTETEALLGIKLADYASALVLTIDGLPALQFTKAFAETQGVYKDLNARYNSAFSRYAGVSSLYYGGLAALPLISAPQKDNITLVVRRTGSSKNETLVIPYFVAWEGSNFTSGIDYWNTYCHETSSLDVEKPPTPTSRRPVEAKMLHKSHIHKKAAVASLPDSDKFVKPISDGGKIFGVNKLSLSAEASDSIVVLVDSYVSTYLLSDKVTGVMIFPDFEGSDGDYSSWQSDVYYGVTYLLSYGAKNLIIDVQDNGGGYAYLSYILIEFLFPGVTFPQYPIQNPATPFIQRLVNKSNTLLENTENWLSSPTQYNWAFDTTPYPDGSMLTSSKQYFFPTVNLTFGGTEGNYSRLYSFPDRLASPLGLDELLLPFADKEPLFPASNILILSNGGCYSTCSLFAYVAQELLKIKVVAIGGIPDLPMAYSAGSAGYSYALSYLLAYDISYLGFGDDPDAPMSLPIQATVGYTGAQAFCRENQSIPADFVFKAADYHIPFTDANVISIATLYNEVAALFP